MEEVFLPEGCISHALSLTSPKDACRSSATARSFLSAANSDEVWERFLPKGYRNLLPRMVRGEDDPPFFNFHTKRELYFRLFKPTLFDGGRLSFVLERSTGKTCFMLSARTLSIAWGDTPAYWKWISLPDSRFSEVAELEHVCWLDIGGRISTQLLSPKTTYVAYLVFKLRRNHNGFDYSHQEALITVGGNQLPMEVVSIIYHNQDDIEERDDDGWQDDDELLADYEWQDDDVDKNDDEDWENMLCHLGEQIITHRDQDAHEGQDVDRGWDVNEGEDDVDEDQDDTDGEQDVEEDQDSKEDNDASFLLGEQKIEAHFQSLRRKDASALKEKESDIGSSSQHLHDQYSRKATSSYQDHDSNEDQDSLVDQDAEEGQFPRRLLARCFFPHRQVEQNVKYTPHSRMDGWMEIILGEFFNDDGDEGDVLITFKEIKEGNWKSGLVVEGIELRPKN